MAFPFGQRFQRGKRFTDAPSRFRRREQTQLFRRQQGNQIQADAGERGAVRDALIGVNLHVVGGQRVSFPGDGGFEIQHRTRRQSVQYLPHVLRWPGHGSSGRFQRKQQEGKRRPNQSRQQSGHEKSAQEDRKRRHSARGRHAQRKIEHGRLGGGLGKRNSRCPLKQPLSGNKQPVQRSTNGVQLHGSVQRKNGQPCQKGSQRNAGQGKQPRQRGNQQHGPEQPGVSLNRQTEQKQHPQGAFQRMQQVQKKLPAAKAAE